MEICEESVPDPGGLRKRGLDTNECAGRTDECFQAASKSAHSKERSEINSKTESAGSWSTPNSGKMRAKPGPILGSVNLANAFCSQSATGFKAKLRAEPVQKKVETEPVYPTEISGKDKYYTNVVIQGFPRSIGTNAEAINTLISDFAMCNNLIPEGNEVKIILQENGCFAALVRIKRTGARVGILLHRASELCFPTEGRSLRPLLTGTFIDAEVAEGFRQETAMKVGVVRGLEGSYEEVYLKLLVLEQYVKQRINKHGAVILSQFLQPYGGSETKKPKWMQLTGGYIILPSMQGENLTKAYNELNMFSKLPGLNVQNRNTGAYPGTLVANGFKFEIYQNLGKFYAARFGQDDLMRGPRYLRLQGVKENTTLEQVKTALQEDGLFDPKDLTAIFAHASNITHSIDIFMRFKWEVPIRDIPSNGKLFNLRADSKMITLDIVDGGPGTDTLREQRHRILKEEKDTSPWIKFFKEALGEGRYISARSEGPAMNKRETVGGISYAQVAKGTHPSAVQQNMKEQGTQRTKPQSLNKGKQPDTSVTEERRFDPPDSWEDEDETRFQIHEEKRHSQQDHSRCCAMVQGLRSMMMSMEVKLNELLALCKEKEVLKATTTSCKTILKTLEKPDVQTASLLGEKSNNLKAARGRKMRTHQKLVTKKR